MRRSPVPVIVTLALGALAAATPAAAEEAFYICVAGAEHQSPEVVALHIARRGEETVDGRPYVWWEMTAEKRDGARLGVRILSERVPMTCPDAPGEIARYIHLTADGKCFDYRDVNDDSAFLPAVKFKEGFLPQPSPYARYEGGFATAGTYLGHVLVRTKSTERPVPLVFPEPRIIRLRPDLLIAVSHMTRSDYAPKDEEGNWPPARPYTPEDIATMLDAGMNLFSPTAEQLPYIQDEPVFFRTTPLFPDTFYRSNYVPGRMYLDEPMVRLGWSGRVPTILLGPEQMAHSLYVDVAAHYDPRQIQTANHRGAGILWLEEPRAPSWETEYWSAWYQLAAGAPGLVHEGRYVTRGYGWEPETLFGEGLEGLTHTDMFNCFNAFLRGAARAHGGYWGMSVYPEGDPELRLPAMKRAYDMGARCIWIWNDPNLPFSEQVRLLRGLSEHMRAHPRGDGRELIDMAKVGIAFPKGHAFSWYGTWGMERERLSREGASYGDISAAGMWEGILCSRRGVEFDFLIDEPWIRDLGYEQLVIVGNDGSVTFDPPLESPRAPRRLALALVPAEGEGVAERMDAEPDLLAHRAEGIVVDGDLSDWEAARWTHLNRTEHGFGDTVRMELVLKNVSTPEEVEADPLHYMGFEYEQLTDELEEKYLLEVPDKPKGTVITKVYPGSPADRAGLREGDVVYRLGAYRTWWAFEMYREIQRYRNALGAELGIELLRSGADLLRPEGDIEADFALAVDEKFLYVAARVTDDVHSQRHFDWEYWKGDSVQVGLAPTLERREGNYGEQDHEFGLVLKDGRPLVWRWKGRRGQPVGEIPGAQVAIKRIGCQTLYEAAVPLAELAPLSPDMWPRCGFDIVVNDSDGTLERKGRLELRPKAMTAGKNTRDFAVLGFEPPRPGHSGLSAALIWQRRCARRPGAFELTVAACSPTVREATVRAVLRSLDSPETEPASAAASLPVTGEPREWRLSVGTDSPPGRYALKVEVLDPRQETPAASDELGVFIYE